MSTFFLNLYKTLFKLIQNLLKKTTYSNLFSKLFETCLMRALLYGMEAWKKLSKAEIQYLEKIQGKALKRIFNLPITTPYIGIVIETGV